MKKLFLVLLFSLAVVSFIIGLHQLFVNGIGAAYPIFMLSLIMLFLYQLLKGRKSDPLA